jgi:hypothetical protein
MQDPAEIIRSNIQATDCNQSNYRGVTWAKLPRCPKCNDDGASVSLFTNEKHPNNWTVYGQTNPDCPDCCDRFLRFMPSCETFLDHFRVILTLDNTAGSKYTCLVHPKVLDYYIRIERICCSKCYKGYMDRARNMARRYLLATCMGLPRELAQEIIWFVVRV